MSVARLPAARLLFVPNNFKSGTMGRRGVDGIPGEEGVERKGDFVESAMAKGATVGGGL